MSQIVDLSGRPVDGEIPKVTPLSVLEDLVAKLKSGELVLNAVYVMGEKPCPNDPSEVLRESWDSGLTAEQAMFWLRMYEDEIIRMARGDP